MKIERIMTREPTTVPPETPVHEVANAMLAQCLNSIAVVDAQGTLIGIVSTGDLTHRMADLRVPQRESWWVESLYRSPLRGAAADEPDRVEGRTAQQVMTRKLVTVTPQDDTSVAARMLLEHRIHAVPVVNREGRLLGMVTRFDLMRCLTQHPECCNPMKGDLPSDDSSP
ncbi:MULTISPECIES: CBS domain-containing protein [Halorhodospira]|uniref:CBS domain-containing protein n=1 Tax=Halorhodospira TaxID=85108 RepID=UPI0019117F70|nr:MULTISPECIES: CBS domain-containing protein [Halorhodospira]MBK5942412.1 histidine kinase [Halorhodospira halophila]MCG5537613.1 CBS domain-containing protein [Halorhodospira sp. 9622]